MSITGGAVMRFRVGDAVRVKMSDGSWKTGVVVEIGVVAQCYFVQVEGYPLPLARSPGEVYAV